MKHGSMEHSENAALLKGAQAEAKVVRALSVLPAPWQIFETVEWRYLHKHGVSTGEADIVVFHPHHGLVVIEIKAGDITVKEGIWSYGSGRDMTKSPYAQARRNMYTLGNKLKSRLGESEVDKLTLTYCAWFPDVTWKGPVPGVDVPSRSFLLDESNLIDPGQALLRIFREQSPNPVTWTRSQQKVLKDLLAPDCHLLVSLDTRVSNVVDTMVKASDQQISVLRMLRNQNRLLVEGGAGTGKTLLACALAKDHAALGKSVLLTCFNKHLASYLNYTAAGMPNLHVMTYHELARQTIERAGMAFDVPEDKAQITEFFRETVPELLFDASELTAEKFDTIIVDEAADFDASWWLGLEAMGSEGFNWYCFFDKKQSIYSDGVEWRPPFEAIPMSLDINFRNTQPIGELAARYGSIEFSKFAVTAGPEPIVVSTSTPSEMADQLRQTLRMLINKENVAPERIVVLSPYRRDNPKSQWGSVLNQFEVNEELAHNIPGKLRLGTLQGFKGLESDVVILVGVDQQALAHPDWLYVGTSRAKGMLYILEMRDALNA